MIYNMFSSRYILFISLSATTCYFRNRYHKSRYQRKQQLSSKLWPQFRTIYRTTYLSNDRTVEPFTREWFMPYVAIKPNVKNTFIDRYPDGYTGPLYTTGPGMIIHPSGLVMARNLHFKLLTHVKICFSNNLEIDGTVLYRDNGMDVAILQIESTRTDWPVVSFRNIVDEPVKRGDRVYTVNTCAIRFSLMDGTVTDVDKTSQSFTTGLLPINIPPDDPLIQHSCPVSNNHLEVALVDSEGRLIGLNIGAESRCVTIAYSLDIKKIKSFLDKNEFPFLSYHSYGLMTYWYEPALRNQFVEWGVPYDRLPDYSGLLIYWVSRDDLYRTSTIKDYEVITHVNSIPLTSMDDWYAIVDVSTDISYFILYSC
ncbi:uncharacterized protein LOC128960102 [Oppia nitens]|uniref:uncharacterized protein LOC128960102 n=1 Tax=Oppia nitens TaxID=1686743 RepID=UPI0023DBFD3C|nr:uncharacterized protein LOC128960102 [Oppia nitens]